MFTDRTYQIQMIKDELTRKRNMPRFTQSIKNAFTRKVLKEKAKGYLILFLETSSIHGLNHFVAARRHLSEVLLWVVIVIMSVFGAVSLSWTTWMRYQSSPTVVSMDRDMFAWNTSFPCVTICPENKVDEAKLELYISNSDAKDKEQLESFIKTLINANFKNLDPNMTNYDGISPDNYLDIILNLSVVFKPTLTIGALGISLQVVPTITEMGLCFAINSQVAVYNSPAYRKANRWDFIDSSNDTFFIHPLDGEVFATAVNLTTSYTTYIHGPLEVPDIATKYEYSTDNFYMKIYVTAISVYTAPDAAKLSVGQRRCRFLRENNLKHNAVYTYNMCRMECRIRLCLKFCQCIPHFYRRIGDEKVCDVKGLRCLANRSEELYKLTNKRGKRIDCGCLSNCDDVNFIIQSNVLQPWFLGTNLQWGLVTYPRLRYRRDIIFGFTDVLGCTKSTGGWLGLKHLSRACVKVVTGLMMKFYSCSVNKNTYITFPVAVGGMAGLFLGCSVLSFMEIVYFLTLRLIFYTRSSIEK